MQEPLKFVIIGQLLILTLLVTRIWIHSLQPKLFKIFCRQPSQSESAGSQKPSKFQNTKDAIIGSGGTLAAVVIIVILIVPAFVAKSYAEENADNLNHAPGRDRCYET
jgi:hypothetical protein